MVLDSKTKRTGDQIDWTVFRQEMPVAEKWAYFDHAAVAPIPRLARDRLSVWAEQAAFEGATCWPSWFRQHEDLRDLTAQVINAKPQEIALIPNTTFGINLVASGLPWEAGDNVVLPEHEFPSNLYPWMHLESQGVELRLVPLDGNRVCPARMADACDRRTRVVSASWVGYASGYRLDPMEIGKVAHDCGALFFLDAIQGLGVFPLDVQAAGIDFLAADGHKWLLGPEGAGVFYVRHDLLETLKPMNIGWNSVKQGNDFDKIDLKYRESASRYEGGTQNMAGFIALGASLELLTEFGLASDHSPIAEQVISVSDELCRALEECGAVVLSDRDAASKTGIVSFDYHQKTTTEDRLKLLEQGVVVSCRGGKLRASVHCYNNGNDIDRLVQALSSLD
ncbi:MAG: aminotransferase class V-fold PLP-dependent enzyme [Mariniblastus sp.]|nr:aminotransferase class V-fold PLP-dependent enzyme [Mariniblastus sp.]